MYKISDDIYERLTRIHAAALNLRQDMNAADFFAVKQYIEKVCEHNDKSADFVEVPPIIVGTLKQMLHTEDGE